LKSTKACLPEECSILGRGRSRIGRSFKDIWIQPASGDAGGALGAALSVWYEYLGNERNVNGTDDMMQGSYLGPSFSDKAIADFISGEGLVAIHLEDDLLFDQVAQLLAQGNVVGWFTRMEFGPRALGHRSILGDARNTDMQTTMNLKIKFRESFRPFAPAVLDLDADKYFILHEHVSPYMLLTTHVREEHRTKNEVGHDDTFGIQKLRQIRSTIPAVTHVDYSARVQTVTPKSPRFHKLLQAFKNQTGCSVLVNTSFNVTGEYVSFEKGEEFPKGTFHTVLVNQVVQYLENPHEVFLKLASVGEYLVMTYPTNWEEIEDTDIRRYTKSGMEQMHEVTLKTRDMKYFHMRKGVPLDL
jgi:carbamoyltransferase